MKTPSVLFSVPLLLTLLGAQADPGTALSLPPASPTGVIKNVRVRGATRALEIMTDQIHVRYRAGKQGVMKLSGKRAVKEIDREASRVEAISGDRADLVAYVPGLPKTDGNKLLITKRVVVRLADGVRPSVFAKGTGAIRARRLGFAEDALVLTYSSATEAMEAADRIRSMPGALDAEPVVAVSHDPDFVPAETYFTPGAGPEYQPFPQTDNVVHWDMVNTRQVAPPTTAYQWWANNIPTLVGAFWIGSPAPGPGPVNSVPSQMFLGDYPPVPWEMSDLRVTLAWEILGDFDKPISGNNRKILILDDGIAKSHPDRELELALDPNPARHFNYETDLATNEPTYPTIDSHGTSLAGIVGARINGKGIAGVAPKCTFLSGAAIKSFIDDLDWAQAFAHGSTLKDSDGDNDLLDEDRSGILFFEVCLNASSESGSRAGLTLYPEDWLWRRAIQYGSTKGRSLSGVIYVTSAGNGGDGHMNTNYAEQKNSIYQIPVAGVSELGRRIAYSNHGANIVCCAPTWGEELPPLLNWPSAPRGWPSGIPGTPAKPIRKDPPIDVDDLPRKSITFPELWRRLTQGIVTIRTLPAAPAAQIPYDFDFGGTSASAAQVAGIVALMLEVNPGLTARDVKEILMRSGRVCNDVRVDKDYNPFPTQWRMGRIGRPLHTAFGAGLVDANRAVKIAQNWPKLPFNPLPPIKLNLNTANLTTISTRNTETGGLYFPVISNLLIPDDPDRSIDIIVPPPPSGLRLEHIEVRVQLYHKRRGDLEIKLIAPPQIGWEVGRTMESELYVAHRDDYTESRWSTTTPELRDPTDWTFSTIRHWGTRAGAASSGTWKVRIRDTTKKAKTTTTTIDDPTYVPVDNPTDLQSQRITGVGITYHGTYSPTLGNEPPVIAKPKIRFAPGNTLTTRKLQVAELGKDSFGKVRFPVLNWDFFNLKDIVPMQPSAPTLENFEYFPPGLKDPADPTIFTPLFPTYLDWPPSPAYIPFLNPPPLGPLGALTMRPSWLLDIPADPAKPDTVTLSPKSDFIVLRDWRNEDPATNYIYVRLNRLLGELEVIPFNLGKYNITILAENLLGISPPQELELAVVLPTYDDWLALCFDSSQLVNPSVVCFECDPDHDDISNGLEFAMRMDPCVADPGPVPAHRIEGNEIVFTYQQDVTVTGVTLTPEVSEDLDPGTSWSEVTPTILNEANGLRDMEVRIPLGDPRIFFRLRATVS